MKEKVKIELGLKQNRGICLQGSRATSEEVVYEQQRQLKENQ